MASFFSHAAADPRFQFATTAVLSGAAVACLIFGYQALDREERLNELKHSIPSLATDSPTTGQVRNSQPILQNWN